jgi:hypothetical protein
MITRGFFFSKSRPARAADNLIAIYVSIVETMWDFQHLTTIYVSTAFYRHRLFFYFYRSFQTEFSIMLKCNCTCTSVEHEGFTRTLCGLRSASSYLLSFFRIPSLLRNCLYRVHLDKIPGVLANQPLHWIVYAVALITYIFLLFSQFPPFSDHSHFNGSHAYNLKTFFFMFCVP